MSRKRQALCPEIYPCGHPLNQHRGPSGDMGCSIEGCRCNIEYLRFSMSARRIVGDAHLQGIGPTLVLRIPRDLDLDAVAKIGNDRFLFPTMSLLELFRDVLQEMRWKANRTAKELLRNVRDGDEASLLVKRASRAQIEEIVLLAAKLLPPDPLVDTDKGGR